MNKRQNNFRDLIFNQEKKRLQKIKTRVTNPDLECEELFDFLTVIVASAAHPRRPKEKDLAEELIKKTRAAFCQLPQEIFEQVAIEYFRRLKQRSGINFDFCGILLASAEQEKTRSIGIFQILLRMLDKYRLPATATEQEAHAAALQLICGLIALIKKVWTWRNVLEQALSRQEEAIAIIRKVIYYLFFYGSTSVEIINSQNWDKAEKIKIGVSPAALAAVWLSSKKIGAPDKARLSSLPETMALLTRLVSDMERETSQKNAEILALAERFKSNLGHFSKIFDALWQDIAENFKYGIRSGLDQVNISVSALKKLGHRKIQFVTDGIDDALSCKAVFWINDETGGFNLTILVKRSKLLAYVHPGLELDDPRAIVDLILAFIATHCFWAITTGHDLFDLPFTENKERCPDAGGGAAAVGQKEPSRSATIVRAMFRRLPENQSASGRAKQLALEDPLFKKTPPPGWTYVSQYCRGKGELVESEPLFCYSDSDLVV